jgi:saccharopine dehydrogenase (NAD+, L-lysine-forming)
MTAPLPVVVYGATGYTGRLLCAELVRTRLSFVATGRDAQKLDALVRGLGQPVATEVAALDDAAALRRMAARGRVVVSCAGPFVQYGKPVQDAALAERRHFLDITGEQSYMRETFGRDAEARARGVALVNAVGFDVVPTDAAAVLAAELAGAPVRQLRIAFSDLGARPTQGTARSALAAAHLGGLAYRDGAWVAEPLGAERWEVPFPAPIGRRVCLSIPWGDLATAPRSTEARNVRCFMAVPKKAVAVSRPALRAVGALLSLGPVRKLGEAWVNRRPEGPSEEERRVSRFAVYAEAVGPNGTHGVWVTGGNGYDFTAASAALCARLASASDFQATGALTPTQAFGARTLLDHLAGAGVRWGSDA